MPEMYEFYKPTPPTPTPTVNPQTYVPMSYKPPTQTGWRGRGTAERDQERVNPPPTAAVFQPTTAYGVPNWGQPVAPAGNYGQADWGGSGWGQPAAPVSGWGQPAAPVSSAPLGSASNPYTSANPNPNPAPFYRAAELPRQGPPAWVEQRGDKFAQKNLEREEYDAMVAQANQPQDPYLRGKPDRGAPFMTLRDFQTRQPPTYYDIQPPQAYQPPAATSPGWGFGTNYGWGSKSYGRGGYGGYGSSGYKKPDDRYMGLYSWNFKG